MQYDYRPDAQAFDEIRITTIPRYKQSGLSGDEWRISAQVEFYRKGEEVHIATGFKDVESACRFMAFTYARACDDGHGYFAGIEGKCDQEGCDQAPTVFYKRKKDYCHSCGHGEQYKFKNSVRKFCNEHKTRGDCGRDDSDENYEPIEQGII